MIDADPARRLVRRGRIVSRIDVGAKVVTRHAIERLRPKDIFGWHLLGLVKPTPDCRLRHIEVARHLAVGTRNVAALDKGLISSERRHHGAGYTCSYNAVNT